MPALWRLIAVIAGVTTVACLEMRGASDEATSPADNPPASSRAAYGRAPLSAASCFGATCHGQAEGSTAAASSACAATFWIDHDRHTRAFDALKESLAVEIMKKLDPKGTSRPADADARCLACHSNPKLVFATGGDRVDTSPDVVAARREGVNCETCHGDPTNWLPEHATWHLNESPEKLRDLYETKGMTWLNDLSSRAELCVGCHVGTPENRQQGMPRRDVTHDLIAAGHPRLAFEFQSYMWNMPPHWKERDRTAAPKSNEASVPPSAAQIWAAGQKACAAAASSLSESQARPNLKEFARSSCFACHHDLDGHTWRQPVAGTAPGSIVPDTWNFFLSSRPQLGTELKSVNPKNPSEAMRLLRATLLESTSAGQLSQMQWDYAAQIYLALVAWKAAAGKGPDGFDSELQNLEKALRFPGANFNSPQTYNPAKIEPSLRSLREMIERWDEKGRSRTGG